MLSVESLRQLHKKGKIFKTLKALALKLKLIKPKQSNNKKEKKIKHCNKLKYINIKLNSFKISFCYQRQLVPTISVIF